MFQHYALSSYALTCALLSKRAAARASTVGPPRQMEAAVQRFAPRELEEPAEAEAL